MSTTQVHFEIFHDDDITDTLIDEAATLFTENYGVWGPLAASELGDSFKEGQRVRMGKKTLRKQCVPAGSENIYIRAMVGVELVGNVFATRWTHEQRNFRWITQLVVAANFRRQTLATRLLRQLSQGDESVNCIFGVLSSQPATIMATLRAFGEGLEKVDLKAIQTHTQSVIESCPVTYVRNARLHRSLFEKYAPANNDGAVLCAFTNFWVDHKEPLETLQNIRDRGLV